MNKLKLILFLLILAPNSFAVEMMNCSTSDIEIKAAGFLGLGEKAKKIKTIGKLTTQTNDNSSYERSFEIGRYRFVKEKNDFITYRKNDAGTYEQKDNNKPIRVLNDHSIYVSHREGNTLVIRRSGDDKNKQEMTIVFGKKQMSAKISRDGVYSEILNYTLCPKNASQQSAPAAGTTGTGVDTGN